MKRLLVMFLLLVLPVVSLMATEVEVVVGGKKYKIVVPDNIDDLKKAYIEMSKLYLAERIAHEASIANFNELVKINKKLQTQNARLVKTIEDFLRYNPDKRAWHHYLVLGSGFQMEEKIYTFQIMYQANLYDKFVFGVGLHMPVEVSLYAGIKLW